MFGTDTLPIPDDLPEGVTIRPKERVFRSDPVLWEVLHDGQPVGHLAKVRIGRAVNSFYEATAYMPDTGEPISVEFSSSVAERCAAILEFRADPWASVHLPQRLQPEGAGWVQPRLHDEGSV